MPTMIITGAQWGDEGKGKIVDEFSLFAQINARFNGADNAGHTTHNEFGETKLHLIPCGIFNPQCICVIERGVLVNPINLVREMQELSAKGVSLRNLRISPLCQMIMPWHIAADKAEELKFKIGTTHKGVGPCAESKANRRFAFRIYDLLDSNQFAEKFRKIFELKKEQFKALYGRDLLGNYEETLARIATAGLYLQDGGWVTNTQSIIQNGLKQDKFILLEGAQGILLDQDWGTFPFTTSTNTTSVAALMLTGIPANAVKHNIGIAKAYITRVGEGSFPTEISTEEGKKLQDFGKEFGTTTGRLRRCGWLDLPLLRYAARINNFTGIALTKVDILGKLSKIKLCTGYKNFHGSDIDDMDFLNLGKMEPIFQEIDGNWGDLNHCRRREEFPKPLRNYLEWIEKFLEIPVILVSTGESKGSITPPIQFFLNP